MKAVWKVARAVVAAAALALAGGAQAVVYDVNFDPDGFFGNGQIDINPACLALADDVYANSEFCGVGFDGMYTHDSGHGNWFSDNFGNISSFEIQNHQLVAIEGFITLFFQGFDASGDSARLSNFIQVGNPCGEDAQSDLNFGIDGRPVSFLGCAGLETSVYTITRVPEPASIGLTLAGLGALWLGRRRRKQS